MDAPSPRALTDQLIALLDVEQLDRDLYRGHRKPGGRGRVFGGQVIGQALQAAQRSTDPRKAAHSLHAYFMRPGDEDFPIIFRVVRDFEGSSFATRRVIAMQKGEPILSMTCSFQRAEAGLHHQLPAMPDVPGPEGLTPTSDLNLLMLDTVPEAHHDWLRAPRPIEMRPVEPTTWTSAAIHEAVQYNWFRVVAPLGDDPALHRAALAYTTDIGLLGSGLLPHGKHWLRDRVQTASLDHAVWFHEDFRADEWLLYVCDSPWSGHARAFNRGQIFAADGRLVASASQEGLIRLR